MGWILKDPNDNAIIEEIEKQSDRGAIIISTAFLEKRLEEAIKLHLKPDIDPVANGKMFKGYGPLASFAAKIDLGFLLQIYPEEVRDLFHAVRNIRNDAAHETTAISFEMPSVRDKCNHSRNILMGVIRASGEHRHKIIREIRAIPEPKPVRVRYDGGYESEGFSIVTNDSDTVRKKFSDLVRALLFHLHEVNELFELRRLRLRPLQ